MAPARFVSTLILRKIWGGWDDWVVRLARRGTWDGWSSIRVTASGPRMVEMAARRGRPDG